MKIYFLTFILYAISVCTSKLQDLKDKSVLNGETKESDCFLSHWLYEDLQPPFNGSLDICKHVCLDTINCGGVTFYYNTSECAIKLEPVGFPIQDTNLNVSSAKRACLESEPTTTSTTTEDPIEECKVEHWKIDGDYIDFTVDKTTLQECYDLCKPNDSCQGISYNSAIKTCWRYSRIVSKVFEQDCITVQKYCVDICCSTTTTEEPPIILPSECIRDNRRIIGIPIGSPITGDDMSIDRCYTMCYLNDECVVFNYYFNIIYNCELLSEDHHYNIDFQSVAIMTVCEYIPPRPTIPPSTIHTCIRQGLKYTGDEVVIGQAYSLGECHIHCYNSIECEGSNYYPEYILNRCQLVYSITGTEIDKLSVSAPRECGGSPLPPPCCRRPNYFFVGDQIGDILDDDINMLECFKRCYQITDCIAFNYLKDGTVPRCQLLSIVDDIVYAPYMGIYSIDVGCLENGYLGMYNI